MGKVFWRIVSVVVLILLAPGCTFIRHTPWPAAEFRISSGGLIIYNQSKKPLSDIQWSEYFRVFEAGHEGLKNCVVVTRDHHNALRKIPLIIVPSGHTRVLGKKAEGFTTLTHIFISSSYMHQGVVLEELLHIYLYLFNFYPLGDVSHTNSVFRKCSSY